VLTMSRPFSVTMSHAHPDPKIPAASLNCGNKTHRRGHFIEKK